MEEQLEKRTGFAPGRALVGGLFHSQGALCLPILFYTFLPACSSCLTLASLRDKAVCESRLCQHTENLCTCSGGTDSMGRWCRTSGTWLQLERAELLPREPAWGSPLLSFFPPPLLDNAAPLPTDPASSRQHQPHIAQAAEQRAAAPPGSTA